MPEPAFPWLESKTPRRTADDLLAELDEIAPQRPAQQPETKPSSGGVVRLAQLGIPGKKKPVSVDLGNLGDSAFSDSVERGTAQLFGSVDYAASLIGRLAERARIPGAKEYADRKLNEATELFGYAEKRPGRVSLEDLIKSPTFAKAGTFLAEVAGEQLPNLLLTFGVGGVVGAAAKKAAVAGATKQILQRTGQQALTSTQRRAVAKVAGQKAAQAGTLAATATVAPLEAGEAGYGIRQETGEDSPVIALGAGVVNAYLEKLVPQKILKDIFTSDSPTKKLLWREVVGNTASTVARNLAQEGLTEIAQESVQIAATKLADSSYDAVNRDNFWRLLEAGVKGAIVGGSISVPTSAYSQTRRKLTADQLNSEIGKAAATIDKEMRRRRDEEIKQQAKATREKDTTTPAGAKPATPTGSATTVGTTAEQAAPRQADQDAPQGVVAAGNERVVGGKTYTKKGDFWYYTDKKGREKIVEGGTPKQEKLLEELEAPTTNTEQISSSPTVASDVRESRVDYGVQPGTQRRVIAGQTVPTWIPNEASDFIASLDPERAAAVVELAEDIGHRGPFSAQRVERAVRSHLQQLDPEEAIATEQAASDLLDSVGVRYSLSGRETQTAPPLVATPPASATPPAATPQALPPSSQTGGDTLSAQSVAQRRLETAKAEIEQDIRDGTVPATVRSFSELADHVDANLYVNDASRPDRLIGPLGKRLGWKPADYAEFTNGLIRQLDQWLASGRSNAQPTVRDSIATTQESTAETLPQSNTLFVAQAVRQAFGFNPERVQIVYEPSAPWNARVVGDVIQLNSARLDAREVGFKIAHELAHILYRTPVFRDAFTALLNSLSAEERARVDSAIALYKDQPQSIQDEEAQVRALEEILRTMKQPKNRTAWQKFTDLVAEAFYSFFGVQTTNREELAARVVAISGVAFLRGQGGGGVRESLRLLETGSTRESLPTTPGQVLVASNATVVHPDVRESLVAHHGTPHKVDKFTTAKIGTGEGAQVYGWGLYFAENPEVAEEYRDTLSKKHDKVAVGGKILDDQMGDVAIAIRGYLNYRAGSPKMSFTAWRRETADRMRSAAKYGPGEGNPTRATELRAAADFIEGLNEKAISNRGNAYTVRLNVETEQLLDWDKPLSEQSDYVKKALSRFPALRDELGEPGGLTGDGLYKYMSGHDYRTTNSAKEKATSLRLLSIGIKGIRYLDQGSRVGTVNSFGVTVDGKAVKPTMTGTSEQLAAAAFARFDNEANPAQAAIDWIGNDFPTTGTKAKQLLRAGKVSRSQTYNYVIFDENDIEITHENGQPVSFAEATGEVRESLVTPAQDAAYMDAVNRGDMVTAQRMVDEAARAAGYTIGRVYHGSQWPRFTIFDKSKLQSDSRFHFDPRREVAEGYANIGKQARGYSDSRAAQLGEEMFGTRRIYDLAPEQFNAILKRIASERHVLAAYLRIDQLDDYSLNADPNPSGLPGDFRGVKKETGHYAVFDPRQIKSADPVTYDDSGNVIPLSKRFSPESSDIRYDLTTRAPQVTRQRDLQSTPEQQQEYLSSAFTQNAALYRPLSRIAEVMGASPKVKAMLGLQQIEKLFSVIPWWSKKMTYDEMMREVTDEGARKNAQWDVFQRLMLFQDQHETRKRKLRDLIAKINHSRFIALISKEQIAKERLEAKSNLVQQFRTVMSGAVAGAMSRLERVAASREEQLLRAEIKSLENQRDLSEGVGETAVQIVNAIANDMDIYETLIVENPSPEKILSWWRQVNPEAPTSTPTAKLAAYILSRNNKIVLKLAVVQQLLENQEVRDEVSRTEKTITSALGLAGSDAERMEIMQKYFEKAKNKQDAEFRAYRRWFDLNQSIQREVERFDSLTEAIRIGEAVINDDEFKRVRMETQKVVNTVVTPPWWSDKKRKEFAENSLRTKTDFSTLAQMGYVHVVLPDGTQHIHHLAADKKDLEKAVEALAKDADIITDWLSENPDSPYAPFYQIQLDQIRGTYLTSLVGENNKNLAIAHGIPLLSSSLGMLRWALKDIGTPSAKIAAKLTAIWDIHSEFMETWMPTWYPGAVRALYDAAESHDFIKKAKSEGDRNWFIVWKREIGNELMARLQNKGSGIDVGSTLSSGYQVTKADMAYVRYLQRAFSAAYAKIEQPMQSVKGLPEIQDFIANRIPVVRERLDRGDIVLPRRLDRELGPLVGDVMRLLRTGPYAGRIEAAEEILSSDKLWPQVESYLHDMHPDFAERTRLTDALKLAGERLMEKRAAERNGTRYEKDYPEESMQGLYEFVADHIDTTESEGEMSREDLIEVVRREFLGSIQSADGTTRPRESLREDELRFVPGEFGNILERFESAATTPDDYTKSSEVTILDQHNSFNASRGRRIAPYGFYTHGVTTEGDWLSFRSNGASFQMEMMVASLRAVIRDLETKLLALKKEFGSGNQLPAKAIRQGRAQLQSGETMYEWDKLQDQIDRITKFIASLESAYGKGGRANTHELRKLSRAVGLLVRGLLTSGLVAIGNVISPQAAAVRSSITGAATMSFARAYGNLARVMFQMGIGAMKSVPPAARRALSSVASMKIPDAVGVWEELFEGAMARGGANAELKRLGLDKPLRMRQKLENMVILPRTGGRLTESVNREGITGAVSDTIGVLTTLAEAAIVFAEPLQPEYGDRLVNAAAYRDGVGLTEWVEDRLRRVYGRYRESGRDPKTAPLNASDIYGNWLLRRPTQSNLNNLTEWFNLAGIPFRETAHRFFDALDAAPNKDDVSLLTPTEQDVMATVLVPEINKATRSTRPIATSTDFWAQMFLLLKGWSFFDITRKRHRFGTAATAKGSEVLVNRVQQLMLIAVVTAMMGAVGWDLVEILKRYWAKYLRGEERASRAWWEQEGLDKLKGLAKSWGTQWPIVGDMIVGFADDLPGSARQGSLLSPVILSKLGDIGRYVTGAVNTQDPRFGASQLLKGLMPEPASVVLNRMPTESGSVAMVNARRLLSRFGDKEWLVKPMGFGMSGAANYTPIHPVIERAVNAIGNGDFEKFQRHYDEAVQMAEEDGKDYRTVLSMLKSRHPIKRAYGKAVPADIMEKFLSRMGDQRASVEEAISRYDQAVAMVSPVKTRALPVPSVASYSTPRASSRKVDLTPAYMRGSSKTARSSSSRSARRPTLPARFRMPTLAQAVARRSNARRRPTIRI